MSQAESDLWVRARHAQDKLIEQFLSHPDVSLIDIGYPIRSGQMHKELAVRIHVREPWAKAKPEDRVAFPKQIDGIPVIILFGDYQLEADSPYTDQSKM